MNAYGKSMTIDLHGCNVEVFDRANIRVYFKRLCRMIGAERGELHFWDEKDVPPEKRLTDPRLIGTSAVQFILTSGIVVHTLDKLERVYVDVFSCDDFDTELVLQFTRAFFRGTIANSHVLERD